MRVLILYANPIETSFGAAVHRQVLETLRRRNHSVDDCDLYSEEFDPVLSRDERAAYHDPNNNRAHIETYAHRLLSAEALILIYPVWNEGFPAILKGFFDRVFIPGVSFKMDPAGAMSPSLENLTRIAAVCTYGADRISTFILGDPPRRVVKRLVRSMPGRPVKCQYLAQYDMNCTTAERRAAFVARVVRTFEAW